MRVLEDARSVRADEEIEFGFEGERGASERLKTPELSRKPGGRGRRDFGIRRREHGRWKLETQLLLNALVDFEHLGIEFHEGFGNVELRDEGLR